jgi:hypothetical protein
MAGFGVARFGLLDTSCGYLAVLSIVAVVTTLKHWQAFQID